MTSPLMDEKNLDLKVVGDKPFTEEEARLALQGKTLPPQLAEDEMVE